MRTDGRVERGRATRDGLIATARELFGRHGYDGVSIAAVLEAAGVARGALYHHFASKEALFDAVLDNEVARIATTAGAAARAADDPVAGLRAACETWLAVALDPAVQRIVLLDPPAVLGWSRWRELDERHTLGGLRANIERMGASAGVPPEQVDPLAHMILAAVSEAALLIARAEDPDMALTIGRAAVDTLLTRLFARQPGLDAGPVEAC